MRRRKQWIGWLALAVLVSALALPGCFAAEARVPGQSVHLGAEVPSTGADPASVPGSVEVEADKVYCFTGTEFFSPGQTPEGLYLRSVPEACRLALGTRELYAGDVLSVQSLDRLRLEPQLDEAVTDCISYCPIYGGQLGEETVLTMHILSTENEAPTAQDQELETYRNLPTEGQLSANDPEGELLTYRLSEKPRRGTVELSEDGSFVYTPKKNKVGEDRFTFTATDISGNVSNEGVVTVHITQPLDAETFDDLGPTAQFPAMWLKEQGLFGGERVTDKLCFCPEKSVSRGEFLVMCMELAGIDPEIGLAQDVFADQQSAPVWQQPYLSSALRRGIVQGRPGETGLEFAPNEPITVRDARTILSRVFQNDDAETLADPAQDLIAGSGDVPAWTGETEQTILNREYCARLL